MELTETQKEQIRADFKQWIELHGDKFVTPHMIADWFFDRTARFDGHIPYKGYFIFHNNFDEYCVCPKKEGGMVTYNSGFYSLEKAQAFIDAITDMDPEEFRKMHKEELEKLAAKMK